VPEEIRTPNLLIRTRWSIQTKRRAINRLGSFPSHTCDPLLAGIWPVVARLSDAYSEKLAESSTSKRSQTLDALSCGDGQTEFYPTVSSQTPAKPGIAPELGEHNDTVLFELGFSAAEVADLRARKII
jgi:hypothetical protein